MKKLASLIIAILLLLMSITGCDSSTSNSTTNDSTTSNFTANKNYEEQFIGSWATSSGGNSIIYTFEYEDGVYKATCVTTGYNVYVFDKYTASSKAITLYQDGKTTKYYYSFEDEYLYLDDLEFERFK